MSNGINLALQPFRNFDEAGQAVLDALRLHFGLGSWMIIRDQGDSGIILTACDHTYGIAPGQLCRWSGELSAQFPAQRAVIHGASPGDTTNALMPLLDFAPVRAYVAAPLYLGDGDLFGALCGLDPKPPVGQIASEVPIVELAARLLASLLEFELKTQQATRRADRLEAESKLDPLTGLYNRRGWDTLLEREEGRCRRYGNTAAIISIDLNELKLVNDAEGHAAGDRLIAATARCLSQMVRNTDVVARLGGDEFGVLLVEVRAQEAEVLLGRLRTRLAQEKINAALGLAVREPMSTLFSACERADDAMYCEKRRLKASDTEQS